MVYIIFVAIFCFEGQCTLNMYISYRYFGLLLLNINSLTICHHRSVIYASLFIINIVIVAGKIQ